MPPCQIVAQSRIEVSINVKHIAFAIFGGFDDGFVRGGGFADSKSSGTIAISPNEKGSVTNCGTTSLDFLNSVDFDGAFSPVIAVRKFDSYKFSLYRCEAIKF